LLRRDAADNFVSDCEMLLEKSGRFHFSNEEQGKEKEWLGLKVAQSTHFYWRAGLYIDFVAPLQLHFTQ
jgi:hypothetical protein